MATTSVSDRGDDPNRKRFNEPDLEAYKEAQNQKAHAYEVAKYERAQHLHNMRKLNDSYGEH
jgi:hypothetical protein